MTTQRFDQPLIAIDVVALSMADGDLAVYTSTRANEPYQGREALPGVLMQAHETIDDAARRVIAEKTELNPDRGLFIQAGVFDHPDRDPRSRAISIVYLFITDVEHDDFMNIDMFENVELPFMHNDIGQLALDILKLRVDDRDVLHAFWPDGFTSKDYIILREDLYLPVQKNNITRYLSRLGFLNQVDDKRTGHSIGRPANAWIVSQHDEVN